MTSMNFFQLRLQAMQAGLEFRVVQCQDQAVLFHRVTVGEIDPGDDATGFGPDKCVLRQTDHALGIGTEANRYGQGRHENNRGNRNNGRETAHSFVFHQHGNQLKDALEHR